MKQIYRQGDVYIFAVDEIGKRLEAKESVVLAEGEATGHKHVLVGDTVESKILAHYDGQWWIDVQGGSATVTHEEHHPITLPEGKYKVIIQREYSPLEYSRKVVD